MVRLVWWALLLDTGFFFFSDRHRHWTRGKRRSCWQLVLRHLILLFISHILLMIDLTLLLTGEPDAWQTEEGEGGRWMATNKMLGENSSATSTWKGIRHLAAACDRRAPEQCGPPPVSLKHQRQTILAFPPNCVSVDCCVFFSSSRMCRLRVSTAILTASWHGNHWLIAGVF